MGMVLAGLSIGSMTGVLLSGSIIRKRGTRFTMLLGLAFVCASTMTMSMGVLAQSQLVVALGLGFFGLGMGTAEIAINMDAAVVEQGSGRHVMHLLHGCFSLGTLVGALFGLAANAGGVSVALHLGAISLVVSLLLVMYSGHVPSGFGVQSRLQMCPAQRHQKGLSMARPQSAHDWLRGFCHGAGRRHRV